MTEQQDKMAPCGSCGGKDFKFLFGGHDYLGYSPLTFNVVKCLSCGLTCLNPRPGNLVPFYDAYFKNILLKDAFGFPFLLPDRVKKINNIKTPGRILDVGCGKGGFLCDMRKGGWDVYGCDISPESCEMARNENGLTNISNADVLSLDLPPGSFDVITLWHVLEHLTSPKETLSRINRLLKPDGILIIESPDFSSVQSRFFKSKWYSLDLPRHITQFTPATIAPLLQASNLRAFKKDFIVNPRMNFVSLKKSLMRYSGLEKYPVKAETRVSYANDSVPDNAGMIHRLFRLIFNYSCLLISIFLLFSGGDDSFRLYCRKFPEKEPFTNDN